MEWIHSCDEIVTLLFTFHQDPEIIADQFINKLITFIIDNKRKTMLETIKDVINIIKYINYIFLYIYRKNEIKNTYAIYKLRAKSAVNSMIKPILKPKEIHNNKSSNIKLLKRFSL
jgi:hypothetical protein